MTPANTTGTFTHQIKAGDTLFNLAKQYNSSTGEILSANPGVDSNNLKVGQTINIPARRPVAQANIRGGPLRPQIEGVVRFYEATGGTWVCAEVNGLPPYQPPSGPTVFISMNPATANPATRKILFRLRAVTGIPPTSPMATMRAISRFCFQTRATPICASSPAPLGLSRPSAKR